MKPYLILIAAAIALVFGLPSLVMIHKGGFYCAAPITWRCPR